MNPGSEVCENSSEISYFVQTFLVEIIEQVTKKSDDTSGDEKLSKCSIYDGNSTCSISDEEMSEFVENTMKEWNENPILEEWSHSLKYIDRVKNESMNYCAYEVKWAKPMEGCANPVLSVSVFVFVKLFSENLEDRSSCDMSYIFEGHKAVHESREKFEPMWLVNAYENKKSVLESFINYL